MGRTCSTCDAFRSSVRKLQGRPVDSWENMYIKIKSSWGVSHVFAKNNCSYLMS